MIIVIIPINSSLYYATLFIALLTWPLSAQSQTINYAKDGKVLANACAAYLSSGKSPAPALQRAGFRKNPLVHGKNKSGYVKREKPLWPYIAFTAARTKNGPACGATFTLRFVPEDNDWDRAAGHAIHDAFRAAFAAKGYKKTVKKIEKGRFEGGEETYFVKGNSIYLFEPQGIPLTMFPDTLFVVRVVPSPSSSRP